MVLENFLDYTEVDTVNDRIQRTGDPSHHIDHKATRNEDTYVYKDKDAGHFGSNFEHLIDIQSDFAQTYAYGTVWCLANVVDDVSGLQSGTYILVEMYHAPTNTRAIRIWERYSNTNYLDTWTSAVANTWYYLRIKKVGTTFTCKIYDTAASRDAETADAHLLITLSLTLQADYSFRYIYGCNTINTGNSYYLNNDIDNLDLQEVVALEPVASIIPILKGIGLISLVKPKFKSLFPKFRLRIVI